MPENTSNNSPMASRATTTVLLIVAVFFVLSFFVFFVYEGQKALVQRFGKIHLNKSGEPAIYEPGIHIALPLVDHVLPLDVKMQLLNVPSERIYTKEQKTVTVDFYTAWRVADPSKFYLKLNADYERAKYFLRTKINDALREEIGKREVNEVITGQRGDIIDSLRAKALAAVANLGIEVQDVRISRVDYPQEVSDSVFRRMQAAREKEAGMYRSEGDEESEVIRANGDAQRLTIIAKANQESSAIMAKGDAMAADVFNQAYTKNPQFFQMLRTLSVYSNVIKPDETMLVDLKASKLFDSILNKSFGTAAQ